MFTFLVEGKVMEWLIRKAFFSIGGRVSWKLSRPLEVASLLLKSEHHKLR